MKKLLFILLGLFFVVGCNSPKKELVSKEFTMEGELKKDYQFVKIVEEPDTSFVDGYGLPLVKNRWYFRSTKAKTLIPVDDTPDHGFTTNDFEYADNLSVYSILRVGGEVQVETNPIGCRTVDNEVFFKPIMVKMILLGNRYIDVSFNGVRPVYNILTSK